MLPIKFGDPAALPEISYFPTSLFGWLVFSWPPVIFSLIAGVMLFLTAILLYDHARCNHSRYTIIFPLLWLGLAFAALPGFINCSCLDFAYLECIYLFGLAAFALAIFRFAGCVTEDFKNCLIAALVISTALVSIYAIYQYFFGLNETRAFVTDNMINKGIAISSALKFRLFNKSNLVFSTFALSNCLAAHLILTIPLCLWFIVIKSKRSLPITCVYIVFFAVILFPALFFTGSRSAFLCFFCAFIFLIFILPFSKRIKAVALLVCLALSCLALFAFRAKGFDSLIFRLDYYQAAIKMLLKKPFAGVGWGGFFHNYTSLKHLANFEAPHMPHNFLLSMGSQAGILAFIFSVIILIYPIIFGIYKLYRSPHSPFYKQLTFPLLLGWTAWALHSLLDINIQIPGTAASAIFITALMLTTGKTPINQSYSKNKTAKTRTPFITWSILALILVLVTIIPSLNRISGQIAFSRLDRLCNPFDIMNLQFEKNKINMDEVNHSLKNCTRLMPYSPFPWATAGNAAILSQRWNLAEKYYKEAVSRSIERASFYYELGLIQLKLRKFSQARRNLIKAKELFPYKYAKNVNLIMNDIKQ